MAKLAELVRAGSMGDRGTLAYEAVRGVYDAAKFGPEWHPDERSLLALVSDAANAYQMWCLTTMLDAYGRDRPQAQDPNLASRLNRDARTLATWQDSAGRLDIIRRALDVIAEAGAISQVETMELEKIRAAAEQASRGLVWPTA